MNKKNVAKYSYLAGLIDGDGCIVISKSYSYDKNNPAKKYERYILKIEVTTADTRLIKYLVGAYGGRFGTLTRKQPLSPKPTFFWQAYAKENLRLLKKLLPYLHLKKQQAEVGIRFAEIHKGYDKGWKYASKGKRYTDEELKKLEECWLKMKELNQTKIRDLSIVQPQRLNKETASADVIVQSQEKS